MLNIPRDSGEFGSDPPANGIASISPKRRSSLPVTIAHPLPVVPPERRVVDARLRLRHAMRAPARSAEVTKVAFVQWSRCRIPKHERWCLGAGLPPFRPGWPARVLCPCSSRRAVEPGTACTTQRNLPDTIDAVAVRQGGRDRTGEREGYSEAAQACIHSVGRR